MTARNPDQKHVDAIWKRVAFTPMTPPPALKVYAAELSAVYRNGRVALAHAQATGAEELFEMLTWSDWLRSGIASRIWSKEPFRSALGIGPAQLDPRTEGAFRCCTGYELAARLASAIGEGGIRPEPPLRTLVQAFDLAVPAAAALFGDPDDLALISRSPWCDFFAGSPFGISVLGTCRELQTISAILAADPAPDPRPD
ncbi:MAG: hypothetical protein Fur0037_02940 [Planctomycetota bacterium]